MTISPETFENAPCTAMDPDDFFPTGKAALLQPRHQAALAACAGCPLLDTCAEYRRKIRARDGIWAGKFHDANDQALSPRRVKGRDKRAEQLLAILAALADGDGVVAMSSRQLAPVLGVTSGETATAALNDLIGRGWLEQVTYARGSSPATYRLLTEPEATAC